MGYIRRILEVALCTVLVSFTSCSMQNLEVYALNNLRIYPTIERKSPERFERLGKPVKKYHDPNQETQEYMRGIERQIEKIINPDYIPPIPLIRVQNNF